jgi:peptidoglycan hydrolase-like protein with peptidoglycan-binding domain|tara:strand:- start:587 stop:937 length:351 start_codon:yes stop_codon:yes gene_type:complete
MKKYIFTESQIKSILDNVVEEQVLTEQTAELNAKKAIQCFLNKVVGSKLEIDGLHGDGTSSAIAKFQRTKRGLDMDGVWGYSTGSSLTEKEKDIMRDCKSKHGDLIDKFLSFIGIG